MLATTGTTPNDLILLALQEANVVGVGQSPLAETMNGAFKRLNMMLGQWNRRRWLIYHEIDLPFGATGQQSYTLGPGGDVAWPYRPDRLEGAFFRYVRQGQLGGLRDVNRDVGADIGPDVPQDPDINVGIDYPLTLIQSREDWSTISQKTLGQGSPAFPQMIFYDAAYPVGKIYVWPVPQAPYEIHLLLKEELQQLPDLVTAINLPNEYLEAILYNLAVRLGPANGMSVSPETAALARAALSTIRNANAQVPLLGMPAALGRAGAYNPYADTFG